MSLLPLIRKPLLCYVTDRLALGGNSIVAKRILLETIQRAAEAGVDWIQLREKDLSAGELVALAGAAKDRIGSGSGLLINDRLDVACASGAAGIHLGERSLPVREGRQFVEERCGRSEFLMGVSVHSLEAAVEAENGGADYVIFGPVFATPSKASFGEPQGLAELRAVCGGAKIPVLAIGGITPQNANECLRAGANGIAAIRMFQDARDLRQVVSQFRSLTRE
ncbi:MAG TPA: thiamine phosphate synthase [Candidatus Eisenbacteria bacterium]|nr:thiamine phosphate synthase [Candidatus Eisenbacteria bacterium]